MCLNSFQVTTYLKIELHNVYFDSNSYVPILDEMFLPEKYAEMRTPCEYKEAKDRGYHMFNLVEGDAFKWIIEKGKRAVKKCLPNES